MYVIYTVIGEVFRSRDVDEFALTWLWVAEREHHISMTACYQERGWEEVLWTVRAS